MKINLGLTSRRRRMFAVGFCAAAGLLGLGAQASFAALAAATGGGLSGALSSNANIRQQQLICDPAGGTLLSGSDSVKYNPSIVSLSGLTFDSGFTGQGAVEVLETEKVKGACGTWDTITKDVLQPIASFLKCPQGTQTGYVQVYFTRTGAPMPMCAPSGFQAVASAGPAGVDTHALMFSYLCNVKSTTSATYTVYADPGSNGSGNSSDYLTSASASGCVTTLCPSQIKSATVTGSLVAPKCSKGSATPSLVRAVSFDGIVSKSDAAAVPLPASVWSVSSLLVLLAGAGFLRRKSKA